MRFLGKTFRPESNFANDGSYRLLPLRFTRLDETRYVVTSFSGDHVVMENSAFRDLVEHRLSRSHPKFSDVESAHLFALGNTASHTELLAAQYRSQHASRAELTILHIFVLTLRCDHTCKYCQVSRVSQDRLAYDMSEETADRAIDLMFRGPSQSLKVEFQGGESLLNFPLLRHIVIRSTQLRGDRNIEFVAATNLSTLTDEMLDFFAEYHVLVSTSIDGPALLHNRNRPRPGGGAFEQTVNAIDRCRLRLGHESVSALMTCTAESLAQPEEIIDQYVSLGFSEIFLRSISPYGFAVKNAERLGYEANEFLTFYKRGLRHIINLNRSGIRIREVFSSILLRRILTPFADGYVDLKSPAGIGLSVLVYNYDGDVYASDEGRMLAEMGDKRFRLGSVHTHTWETLFTQSTLLADVSTTMTEGLPGCTDCAFQPFCGSDPVGNHATQRDMIGHQPTSAFCRKQMGIFRLLVQLLEDDIEAAKILRRWVT